MFINDLFEKKETKQRLDPKCWTGYKKQGTKMKDGVRVNNCVPANESIEEFAPPGGDSGDNGFSDEMLKRLAAEWYNGDEDPSVERTLAAAGWEIGQDEGYDDEPGVFVVQAGDVNGNSYMSWPAHELKGVAEAVDVGQEWVSDTELDQYVPDHLQQKWRELFGYDEDGNPSALWANLTGGYEPDVSDPQHRALMVKVANKWFATKKIPNVRFFDVKDAVDELEWLVQIGEQGVAEAGPFSYGAKKPRKGSVADLAAKKRKEQERGRQPVEPRDQMVGTARVIKDVSDVNKGISKDKETEFHAKLDRLVHDTFGKRDSEKGMAEGEKKGLYYYVNKRKKAGTSRPAGHPKAPTAQAWKDAAKTAKKENVNEDYDIEVRLMEMRLAGYAV